MDVEESEVVDEFRKQFGSIFDDKKKVFEQYLSSRSQEDFAELGEFFHLHVLVEDAILSFIKSENPNIGRIEKGANQFMQKLKIAQNLANADLISKFNKPLQALNEIRNYLGHHPLQIEYSQDQIKIIRDSIRNPIIKVDEMSDFKVIKAFCIIFCTTILALAGMKELEVKVDQGHKEREKKYMESMELLINKILE